MSTLFLNKVASINPKAVTLALQKKASAGAFEAGKNFVQNLPDNDAAGALGGAAIGAALGGKKHRTAGALLGGAAGYAASGNWDNIGDSLKGAGSAIAEGAKGAWEGVSNLFGK